MLFDGRDVYLYYNKKTFNGVRKEHFTISQLTKVL